MASSQVATSTLPPADRAAGFAARKNVSDALTEDERFELEQCQKIIRFRDEVFAGKHARIKLPAHLATKLAASANKSSPPNLLPASQVYKNLSQSARQENQHAVAADAALITPAPADASLATSSPKAFATGRTEIDPVLLEKSDHLIRAELALQRQKLERALRDEGGQRRAGGSGEPPKELDVSNILAQAMSLAQATTSPSGTGVVETANAPADKESSFDENDYYSSNHESLDSHDSPGSIGRVGPSDVGNRDARSGFTHVVPIRREATPPESRLAQPATDMRASTQLEMQPQPPLQPQPTYSIAPPNLPSRPPSVGTNDIHPDDTTTHSGSGARRSAQLQSLRNSLASGDAPRSDTSAWMEVAQGGTDTSPGQWPSRESGYAVPEQRGPPGLTLSQNTAPISVPAARTSPLITGARQRVPQAAVSTDWNAPRGAPAQVAALRGGHQVPSSPESSSPRGKAPENKKGKKKNKRKADRLAQDAAATPYIKPEPRSPSPLSAPAQIRPAKRQKQAQRADEGATYHQPQPQGPIRPDFYHISGPQPVERPPPVSYRRYATGASESNLAYGGQGYERVYHDDAQPSIQPLPRGHYAPQAPSPRGYPVQYPGEEYGATRSVSYREPVRYYQDEFAHPELEPVVAGAPRPLTRVMVDAFGREYYEPQYAHHPQPVRQSVAPSARPGEPDVIYEGAAPIRHSVAPPMRPRDPDVLYDRPAPARAISRRPPGPEGYEEGGVFYRRSSPPPYPPQRRVVTQPEYGPPEQMGYHRSYSVRPMAPPGDEYAHTPERRPVEGVPRSYTMRSASARPLEPVRYDMTVDGSGHMPTRPEPLPDYGMPRPQSRVDMMGPPVARDFAPRPVETPVIPRAYSTRPVERYYGEPPATGEEAVYVEGPSQPGVVYEPRDVYR